MEDPLSLSDDYSPLSISNHSPIPQDEDSSEGEILVVSVEIAEGKRDVIKVYERDDPWQLASDFAKKHNLDPKLQEALANHIVENRKLLSRVTDQKSVNSNEDPSFIFRSNEVLRE
jgi:hypothetical protein